MLNSVISARLPPAPNADPTRFDIYQNYEFCHADRDALRDFLLSNGIGTIIQWGGLGIHQFKNLGLEQNLPKTDRFFRESILLPLYHVMTNNQVDYVIEKLNDFFQGNSR